MFSNFKPINDYVLIELCAPQEKSKGGIFLPTQSDNSNQCAVVIHAGKNKHIKPGQTIYFKKHVGEFLTDTLIAIKEEFIVGIL